MYVGIDLLYTGNVLQRHRLPDKYNTINTTRALIQLNSSQYISISTCNALYNIRSESTEALARALGARVTWVQWMAPGVQPDNLEPSMAPSLHVLVFMISFDYLTVNGHRRGFTSTRKTMSLYNARGLFQEDGL